MCIPAPVIGAWLGGAVAGLAVWNLNLSYVLVRESDSGYFIDGLVTLNIGLLLLCMSFGSFQQMQAQRTAPGELALERVVAATPSAPAPAGATPIQDDTTSLDRGENPPWLREMRDGGVALRGKSFPKATEHFKAALDASGKLPAGDLRRPITLLTLGYWYYQQERFEEAEATWLRALPAMEGYEPIEPSSRTRMISDLGNCLFMLRKFPEARKMMRRARDRYAMKLGEGHQFVAEVDGNLARGSTPVFMVIGAPTIWAHGVIVGACRLHDWTSCGRPMSVSHAVGVRP